MFEQDYFMRMIMQVTHYIARIVRLREEQKPEQGQLLLGQGYEHFFGLSTDMVERMSAEELLTWFRESGRDHEQVNRAFLEFLQAHIELLEDLERSDRSVETPESVTWRLKKVDFYLLLAVDQQTETLDDLVERMERDFLDLLAYELPALTYRRLVLDYERRGAYLQAEDVLHVWREIDVLRAEDFDLSNFGRSFYERLLALRDEILVAGGLPREEVLLGWEQWRTHPQFTA